MVSSPFGVFKSMAQFPQRRLIACLRYVLERDHQRRLYPVNNVIAYYSSDRFSKQPELSSVVVPIKIPANKSKHCDIGADLTGRTISKSEILKIIIDFYQRPPIRKLSSDNGIDSKLFEKVFIDFRQFCVDSEPLPPDLHIVFFDILHKVGHLDDLYPFFLNHARKMFPHLVHIEELQKISDLRLPIYWYPEARGIKRKIIFHCGPTNSGKTYHALKSFINSESGIYCGPLKLLAVEVHEKANKEGTQCDLITGEERRYARVDGQPSKHIASTVEMVSVKDPCHVAVIDEIQMLRDPQRGWAWTRALLGIPAQEIHICGEEAALDIVRTILKPIDETVEVRRYERLTKLKVQESSLGSSLGNMKAGDCIVCFSKQDLYSVIDKLERLGHEFAVIYGGLPPGTKLAQAKKFNNPKDPCKILVSTDAIGMGLNLSINRIIFYSISKPVTNEMGQIGMEHLSTSAARQIAGRAGRFNSDFKEGYVTTYRDEDLPVLKDILSQPVDPISAVGLHPTADQIEMFSYYLPQSSLSNLIEVFISLCQVDTSNYFMCDVSTFKYLAEKLEKVDLPLRTKFVFCCAPINLKMLFVVSMFIKFSKQYSLNEPVSLDLLDDHFKWPPKVPKFIDALTHLESVFDVLDLYLWLSYRFPDLFPEADDAREKQKQLDEIIHLGVINITNLIRNAPTKGKSKEKIRLKKMESISRDICCDESDLKDESDRTEVPSTPTTNHVIASGTLTAKVVRKMHKEWLKIQNKRK